MLIMHITMINSIEILDRFPLNIPIHAANPEEFITDASDNPPPISMSAPHGIFCATFQFITLFRSFLKDGRINNKIAAAIAMLESFIEAFLKNFF